MKLKTRKTQPRGFALIVTLSLMILLTVIAVGLLTLSSISLRSSGQSNAMATARANARMALMLAIGDLQKAAGPDKAVTATSGIVSEEPEKPNLTGVWASQAINPQSPPSDYKSMKQGQFRRWLVSDANPEKVEAADYADSGFTGETIELVGENSLGASAKSIDKVIAGKVPVMNKGKRNGTFAWHVADEGVKARINSYRDTSKDSSLWQKRALVAGHRPDLSQIAVEGEKLDFLPKDESADDLVLAKEASGKIVSLGQADLFKNVSKIKTFRNDVTPYSLGLLTDVSEGGLKQDLTSLFELGTNMPAPYNSTAKLYQTTHKVSGASDPYWSTLSGYYNMYKEVVTPNTSPTLYKKPEEPVAITSLVPPRKYFPAPVIAKVEAIFTFVVRDAHASWLNQLSGQDPNKRFMGHLLYVPVVTLHNPYNVTLKFDKLKISMKNIPVAFVFNVNSFAQNLKPTPINEMFLGGLKGEKTFIIDIANWPSPGAGAPAGQIIMNPGQTLVCGPYIAPGALWDATFDWQNNMTGTDSAPIQAKPGYLGKSVGFGIDWLTPPDSPGYAAASPASSDNNLGVLGLKATDQIYIESHVIQPSRGEATKFEVAAQITSSGTTQTYGGLSFQYQNQTNLTKLFPTPLRYPQTGTFAASTAYGSNGIPIAQHLSAKAFAIFSAYGRTTYGGVYETGKRQKTAGAENSLKDGRLAGKAFLFHNPARSVVSLNLASEKPGNQSHELNFQPLTGITTDIFNVDSTNRTTYLVSNKGISNISIKSGSYLEIPTGPMQTIADFRRSNALTSSYLPNFTQPVGNSYVSPLMSTKSVSESGIAAYPLLDHSYLANHALYDKFYFSTFAPVDSKGVQDVFKDFMEKNQPLISQVFQPYLPQGKTVANGVTELFAGGKPTAAAYKLAAGYQMVRGPFNVNSTSIQAWKAMLSSMNKSKIAVLWAKNAGLEVIKSVDIPVTAMSLTNGGLATKSAVTPGQIDDFSTNQWNGYRELTSQQMDALATEIVKQVRIRGPFLSMSEFVNRRLGSEDELTRAGALQVAIDKTDVNEGTVFRNQVTVNSSDLTDTTLYGYKTPKVMEGNPAAGAPGWILQGDLMRILEPCATVRSDTFVIRTCGEATDASGKVIARAYSEAVIQRKPEYVNPVDDASVNVYDVASASPANLRFGRKLEIVSFRWLSANEI